MVAADSSYARRVRDCVQPTKLGYRSIVGHFRPGTEGTVMTKIHALVVSAALAIGMAAPASAATTDPEVLIYRFPGVTDDGGGSFVGVATVFHCTNFSGATETIRYVTRDVDGTLKSNATITIRHLDSRTAVTHSPRAYTFNPFLNTGFISGQGTTAIAATSINIICTAVTIDASTAAPVGVALRGIRFNPVPGSAE